jgi:predicted glutamine amidotransferase
MCVIIYKPKGVTLSLSTVLRAYQRNDDGWGIVARTQDGLDVRRGFGRDADEELLDAFDALRAHELVLHCRIATAGERDLRNTHPFPVSEGLFMFHNGTVNVDCSADLTMCDSFHLARQLGETLGAEASLALREPEYAKALGAYAKTSKLVFVDSDGIVIVNESLGVWKDGCWHSNDSALADATAYDYAYDDDDVLDPLGAFGDEPAIRDRFREYTGFVPRCYRVETQEDEDRLYLATLERIAQLEKLDVDEIAEHALDDPEMVAEALSLLLQERRAARRAS